MKFEEEVCECGLDLTKAEPVTVREMPMEGKMVFLGECPQCHTNRVMVPEPAPETEPEAPAAETPPAEPVEEVPPPEPEVPPPEPEE